MKKTIAVLMSIIFIQTQATAMSLGFVIEVNIMTNKIQNKKEVIINLENNDVLKAIINSEYGDILVYDQDSYISADNIELNAKGGNIGSSGNKLKVTDFELVSGSAKGTIDLEALFVYASGLSEPVVYNFGDFKADAGYIDIFTEAGNINIEGDFEAGERIDIINERGGVKTEGEVTAKENINILLEDGNLTVNNKVTSENNQINADIQKGEVVINGQVRAKEEVNVNIVEGTLNISDEIISEESSINANVKGSITDSGSNNYEGFYAENINLVSETGSIGTADNSIRIGETPDSSSVIGESSNRQSTLNAKAEKEINIESSDTIIVSKVETPEDVKIETEKSVYAKEQENEGVNITADNIEVHAGSNVGEQDNRLLVETLNNKDSRVNLEANGEIYIEQSGTNIFYSDYVINQGNGAVDLLLPDNHVYIVNLDVANPNKFKIDFTNLKYKKEISIGHSDVKRLSVHPVAVRRNTEEEEIEEKYNLLKGFKENIIIHPDILSPLKQPVLPKLISKLTE